MKNSSLIDLLDGLGSEHSEDPHVRSPSGIVIDTSGEIWRLGAEGVISWAAFAAMNARVLEACQAFIRHLIRSNALIYALGQHKFMRAMAKEPFVSEMNQMIDLRDVVDRACYERFKEVIRQTLTADSIPSYTGAFVRWYIWATDAGFDLFDPDVACEFESLRVGRNSLGQAVLSHDVDHGPLRDVEMTALRSALKAAQVRDSIDLADLTMVWLMVAFGTNPRNLILLEETDYIRTELDDGQVIHELRIPRIKKRTAGARDQFRTRRMVPEIGELVARLIARNQDAEHIDGAVRPIFRRPKPRPSLAGTKFENLSHRRVAHDLNPILKSVAEELGLTNADGGPLHLNPRRLRYSFATRLVQEGASVQDVADALDHSSTEYVMVYFNARSDAVRNLDRALSAILAPIAQAFLGMVIKSEAEATRVGDPNARIMHMNRKTKKREGLGSCGEFGFCNLAAPLACYTCPRFQAWLEAPHGHILDSLEARRQEKLREGADPKWTQLYDETILAVQLVIQRCDAIKAQDLAA